MQKGQKKQYIHPISGIIREISDIFAQMGFAIVGGPELETEFYNFEALNFPKNHPARDMQDTFWVDNGRLLRTQTSDVQVHYMEENEPPIRIISPGKVFRNEATDMSHEVQFFQIEGLYVDANVSVAQLRTVLDTFFKKFFGNSVEIRIRPGFFPFVEPGLEVDMRLTGDNVPEKLKDKWIEVAGAGMVHPNVLNNVGINSKKYTGFAFGLGVDRMAMLRLAIDDIRKFYDGDLRFVQQFMATPKVKTKK